MSQFSALKKRGLNNKTVTVFGGTGFVGAHLVHYLSKAGAQIIIPSRSPRSAYALKTQGNIGQITAVACDIRDKKQLSKIIDASDYVVNLIGILSETKKCRFDDVHHQFPKTLSELCAKANVTKLVHISAIGADKKSASHYQQSKAKGEASIVKNTPNATILRPSIIFGPEDNFFNRFARMTSFSPFLPLIGGGKTRFQPAYVNDVAQAIMTCLTQTDTDGKTYELGGPHIYSFKQLMQSVCRFTNRKRYLMPVPFWLATLKSHVLKLFPTPLLTPDQVRSLKNDNVVGDDALTLKDLGIQPTAAEMIVPHYLSIYRKGGHYVSKSSLS